MFSHFSFHFQKRWHNPSFTVQSILGLSMYGTNVCPWEMDWSFLHELLVTILYCFCGARRSPPPPLRNKLFSILCRHWKIWHTCMFWGSLRNSISFPEAGANTLFGQLILVKHLGFKNEQRCYVTEINVIAKFPIT